jgi:hypothetical protein
VHPPASPAWSALRIQFQRVCLVMAGLMHCNTRPQAGSSQGILLTPVLSRLSAYALDLDL